jgi:hypothetical protein
MAKKLLVLGVIIVLGVLVAWKSTNISTLHRPIKVENISRITLWSVWGVNRQATQQEVINIVNWFNSSTDVRDANFVGTTEESGITVEEKDGSRFSINRSGEDFEVSRKDEKGTLRSYWARQKEIKSLLDELAKKRGS